MADLKIPNLNNNSNNFLFKKKLSLRRKSKRNLIKESFFMFSFGILIIYLNYLIPNKITIFSNLLNNFSKLKANILVLISYSYQVCIALFIVISLIFAFILMLGTFSRLMKVVKRKSRKYTFR